MLLGADKIIFYKSIFLKKNRIEYYDRMTEVRRTGNYEQWLKFFLEAIYESALDATDTIDKLTALHDKNTALIADFGQRAASSSKLFTYIEENPIIDIQKTATALGMAFNTASAAINLLCNAGVLVKSSGKFRNRIFSYKAYLDLLREGT